MPRLLRWLTYLCLLGWLGTFFMINRLPPPSDIVPDLYRQPIQTARASYRDFTFPYKDHTISVQPMADYYLWGMVVSHNDPGLWYAFDISHDDDSPNVRDLCVIWGENLPQGNYNRVSFHNTDNFCEWSYGPGVPGVRNDQLSNNHLIAYDPAIRNVIRHIHIGDQIYIKGMLIRYTEPSKVWGGSWRVSSMTRTDTGDGACEIIYVEDVQVLRSYNAQWAWLHRLCLNGFLGLLALRIILFLFGPRRYAADI